MSDEAHVPDAAAERLAHVREGRASTSSLGVAEALLVRHSGLEPLAQVMGSSVYQMGWQFRPGGVGWRFGREGQTVELETQTEAWNDARAKAIGRLAEEARDAGADAVVGVSLRRTRREVDGLVEIMAVGTAVRSTRYALADAGEPLLCNLSGQDVAKLIAHGFWPVGIVAGSTIAYVISGWRQQQRSTGWFSGLRNQELPDFARGVGEARLLAMQRVEQQAHALHAHGIVGVAFDRSQRTVEVDSNNARYSDLIVELHVTGTAIVEVAGHQPPPPPSIALPLNTEVRP
jgi:uncharacterized protein YbjQ (UPF0145 family)